MNIRWQKINLTLKYDCHKILVCHFMSLHHKRGMMHMNRDSRYFKAVVYPFIVCMAGLFLAGCGRASPVRDQDYEKDGTKVETQTFEETEDLSEENALTAQGQGVWENENTAAPEEERSAQQHQDEPVIVEADWSEYFDGLNGTAVLYDTAAGEYVIYDRELAMIQSSPCSTFKIVSSLIALENEVLDPEDSVRTWSGEVFWNENWNHDIDFRDAFRASCVWYFRELIDETGKEKIQRELDRLRYGNCDISDGEGRLNTNNSNRALTGFWIESSLKISPKEQVDVMERIFGKDSIYAKKSRDELKRVMLVEKSQGESLSFYGKTGMGKAQGIVVDAWFTGFAQSSDRTVYYCVRLAESDGMEVSSQKAKEIAIRIVTDYLG